MAQNRIHTLRMLSLSFPNRIHEINQIIMIIRGKHDLNKSCDEINKRADELIINLGKELYHRKY